jgi:hypothetical protein
LYSNYVPFRNTYFKKYSSQKKNVKLKTPALHFAKKKKIQFSEKSVESFYIYLGHFLTINYQLEKLQKHSLYKSKIKESSFLKKGFETQVGLNKIHWKR